jgi:hypothetical protein
MRKKGGHRAMPSTRRGKEKILKGGQFHSHMQLMRTPQQDPQQVKPPSKGTAASKPQAEVLLWTSSHFLA